MMEEERTKIKIEIFFVRLLQIGHLTCTNNTRNLVIYMTANFSSFH